MENLNTLCEVIGGDNMLARLVRESNSSTSSTTSCIWTHQFKKEEKVFPITIGLSSDVILKEIQVHCLQVHLNYSQQYTDVVFRIITCLMQTHCFHHLWVWRLEHHFQDWCRVEDSLVLPIRINLIPPTATPPASNSKRVQMWWDISDCISSVLKNQNGLHYREYNSEATLWEISHPEFLHLEVHLCCR